MNKIPDRWLEYSSIGKPIRGTRFITFKVPLKQKLCSCLPEDKHFTPDILLDKLKESGWKLGLIIDLTNTARYYDPQEFQKSGIEYQKIYTEGKVVPSIEVKMKFLSVVENFLQKNTDENVFIGVHCTHGVNRTGHLVCRYMVDKMDFEPENAISLYNEARGHNMERQNYLSDLKQCATDMAKYELYKASGCPEPKKQSKKSSHFKRSNGIGYEQEFDTRGNVEMSHYGSETSLNYNNRNQPPSYRGQYPNYRGQYPNYRSQYPGYRGQYHSYRGQYDNSYGIQFNYAGGQCSSNGSRYRASAMGPVPQSDAYNNDGFSEGASGYGNSSRTISRNPRHYPKFNRSRPYN